MPCLPARFLFPNMMLADRFLRARLGWLPWALVAPHGSPQGRGHLLSPLPACQMDGGQVFLPLPSGCLGLHCDQFVVGVLGPAAAPALSFTCVLNPGNSRLWPCSRHKIPSSPCCSPAQHVTAGSAVPWDSVTCALAQGLVQFPHGCPAYPYPRALAGHEPWKRGLDMPLSPGTWLCPPRGPAVCPLLPCSSLSPEVGLWAVVGHCGPKPSQLPAAVHWLQAGGERSQPWVTVPMCLGTGCRWLSLLGTGCHC